jgi:hypothetical protein
MKVAPYELKLRDPNMIHARKPSGRFRYGHYQSKLICEWLDEQIAEGIWFPVEPNFAVNGLNRLLLVQQGNDDSTVRVCVDLRYANKMTQYSLQEPMRTEDVLSSVPAEAKYLVALDSPNAYGQLPITEYASTWLVIDTPRGRFRTRRLCFGSHNAVHYFNNTFRNVVLAPVFARWPLQVNSHVDDLILHSAVFEELYEILRAVLKQFLLFNGRLHVSKSHWFVRKLDLLGYAIFMDSVGLTDNHVKKVRSVSSPTTQTEARSVAGLFEGARRFIKDYATLLAPITTAINSHPFLWTPEAEASLRRLITAITSYPILRRADFAKPFRLTSDCSDQGCGGTLEQYDDRHEEWVVVRYFSKKLSASQRKWVIYIREAFGIVFGLQQCRFFLLHTQFPIEVLTDHHPLKFMLSSERGMVSKWVLQYFLEFNLVIRYRPGRLHSRPDALSRYPVITHGDAACTTMLVAILSDLFDHLQKPPNRVVYLATDYADLQGFWKTRGVRARRATSFANLIRSQGRHEFAIVVSESTKAVAQLTQLSAAGKPFAVYISGDLVRYVDTAVLEPLYKLMLVEAGLMFITSCPLERANSVLLPWNPKAPTLKELIWHAHAASQHAGVPKITEMISSLPGFKGSKHELRKLITAQLKSCRGCLLAKSSPIKHFGAYGSILKRFGRPVQALGIDCHDMTLDANGFRVILTCVDLFTRKVTFIPMRSKSAEHVVQALMRDIFLVVGKYDVIFSDLAFRTRVVSQLCTALGITQLFTAAHTPHSRGAIEVCHVILNRVSKLLTDVRKWVNALSSVAWTMNATMHSALGVSPIKLATGYDPKWPLDQYGSAPDSKHAAASSGPVSSLDFLAEHQKVIAHTTESVLAHQERFINKYLERLNKTSRTVPDVVDGAHVIAHRPRKIKGIASKQVVQWDFATVSEVIPPTDTSAPPHSFMIRFTSDGVEKRMSRKDLHPVLWDLADEVAARHLLWEAALNGKAKKPPTTGSSLQRLPVVNASQKEPQREVKTSRIAAIRDDEDSSTFWLIQIIPGKSEIMKGHYFITKGGVLAKARFALAWMKLARVRTAEKGVDLSLFGYSPWTSFFDSELQISDDISLTTKGCLSPASRKLLTGLTPALV